MKLTDENFNKLEKYVVVKGDNFNDDRCFIIPIVIDGKYIELTMCMDELDNKVCVCQINGQDVTVQQDLLIRKCLDLLLKEANKIEYNKTEEKEYKYYLNVIKMETECCEYCRKYEKCLKEK